MSSYVKSQHRPAIERDPAVNEVAHRVIAGGGRRRRWSDDDKARIVRESREPGGSVAEVAHRYGLSIGQLYKWRHDVSASAAGNADAGVQPGAVRQDRDAATPTNTHPAFAPVVMATPAMSPHPPACEPGLMEIVIGDVWVRVSGVDIDVERLVAVLTAVRRSR
jgi:transposase